MEWDFIFLIPCDVFSFGRCDIFYLAHQDSILLKVKKCFLTYYLSLKPAVCSFTHASFLSAKSIYDSTYCTSEILIGQWLFSNILIGPSKNYFKLYGLLVLYARKNNSYMSTTSEYFTTTPLRK